MPPRDAGASTFDHHTKAATRLRWHRRRQPFTRSGPPSASRSPSSVRRMGRLQGFWAEDVGERPRRGRSRRSRVDEMISCLAVGHCCFAQPPASVVLTLSAPPSRTGLRGQPKPGVHSNVSAWSWLSAAAVHMVVSPGFCSPTHGESHIKKIDVGGATRSVEKTRGPHGLIINTHMSCVLCITTYHYVLVNMSITGWGAVIGRRWCEHPVPSPRPVW